ncbi:MAG: adenylate/guanylate cyclase domain-containing protein [Armatimonadota bacterium]|nr:adenylate/guanylate cyclase domain-containing protein [Armatimonadota bacterium]
MAFVIAVLGVMAGARLHSLRALELLAVEWRLRLDHPRPDVDDFVLVGITSETLDELPLWGPTALERSRYVPVIRNLDSWGARTIALDVFFAGESDDPDADPDLVRDTRQLAEAIAGADNVVIVAGANPQLRDGAENARFQFPAAPVAAAACTVASPLLPRPDNTIRRVESIQEAADGTVAWPSLSRALLRDAVKHVPSEFIIHWAGPAGTVKTVPFEDVAAGTADPGAFRGRFALIGVTDEIKDLFSTPVGPMSGVEIHAQAAATILSGKYVREAGATTGLLIALPACLLVSFVGRGGRLWWTWGVTGLVGVGWTVAAALVFVRSCVLLPVIGPGFAMVACGVLVSALQSEAALSSLGRLWPSWVSEEGEQLEVTVLVCDMAGYTERSERSSAAEMMEMMREFFAIVDGTVAPHGGISARRPGDAAVVFFRPDDDRPHHARRALAAAQELRHRLAERWPSEDIGFGLTLTTGEVSLGWVGEQPPEPQILGDPVNVAFRLQSECRERGCPILADWATATADEETSASMRPLGQVQVRNRREPVQIFAPAGQ